MLSEKLDWLKSCSGLLTTYNRYVRITLQLPLTTHRNVIEPDTCNNFAVKISRLHEKGEVLLKTYSKASFRSYSTWHAFNNRLQLE